MRCELKRALRGLRAQRLFRPAAAVACRERSPWAPMARQGGSRGAAAPPEVFGRADEPGTAAALLRRETPNGPRIGQQTWPGRSAEEAQTGGRSIQSQRWRLACARWRAQRTITRRGVASISFGCNGRGTNGERALMRPALTLFHFPGACSRVTLNALEEIGVPYEDRPVDISSGEQRQPSYLEINPKGKVPALRIGEHVLAENAAILHYLHVQHPSAHLLPTPAEEPAPNAALEDLVWCSSTLHVLVRQIRMPIRFSSTATEGVRVAGINGLTPIAERLARRLADRWWYGANWSIVDVYLYWLYSTAASAGFEVPAALENHARRVRARPSFQRALAREQAALERLGVELPLGAQL